MRTNTQILILLLFIGFCFGCKTDSSQGSKTTTTASEGNAQNLKIPTFSGDSAYAFLEKQLEFGPRVPGMDGHVACKDWMAETLSGFGAKVIKQDFTAKFYTGESFPATNVIAQFNPKHQKRIIIAAHWDSRMFGDADEDETMRDQPILGADDGGSGVAVILEIARLISENSINMGIDLILFDAEDQGKRGSDGPREYWCLGSQHWSRNKHTGNYKAKYGILLDMVGSHNPRFGQDQVSLQFAGREMNKFWTLAQRMGYGDMFVNQETGGLTDDHYFVNIVGKIPMFDIINQPIGSSTGFNKCWHSHCDDITNISKRSLKVVGQVVTAGIYRESIGKL